MKTSNSQKRIREMMDKYGLSQTELCNRTGILKSALSNYLSGTREPRQDQKSLLADPFGINPAWLMGYDVPMYIEIEPARKSDTLNRILQYAVRMNPEAQNDLLKYAKYLNEKNDQNDEEV